MLDISRGKLDSIEAFGIKMLNKNRSAERLSIESALGFTYL